MDDAVAYVCDAGGVDVGVVFEVVEEVGKCGCVVCDGGEFELFLTMVCLAREFCWWGGDVGDVGG